MKKIVIILLMCLSLLCISCRDEKTAQEYAGKLVKILKTYREQVNQKITVEQEAYKEFSKTYLKANDQDIGQALLLERDQRARKLTDKFLSSNTVPTYSEIIGELQDYANQDFELTRNILEKDLAARNQYLSDLESLEVESKNIDMLIQELDELSKPKSKLQQIKDLVAFGKKVDEEFSKLTCETLNKEITALEKKVEVDKIGDKVTELNKKIEDLKMKLDNSMTDEKKRQKLKERIVNLENQIANLSIPKERLEMLKKKKLAKNCS